MAASAAAVAGGEPQKQLASMIREFATDESHGERGMSDLKRRLDGVRAAYDSAAGELEAAKRAREDAEQELSGSQLQVAIAVASIHTLEATISHLQEEISKVGSDLDALKFADLFMFLYHCYWQMAMRSWCLMYCLQKGDGDIERDEFISQMDQLNTKLRQFQQMVSVELYGEMCSELPSGEGQHVRGRSEIIESEGSFHYLIDNVNNADSERSIFEEQYKKYLLDHHKVTGKDCHRKGFTFLHSTGECESSDDDSIVSDDETIRELLSFEPSTSGFLMASSFSSVDNGQNSYASDQLLSTLPSLPHLEIPQRKGPLCIGSESDNDDTTTTSSQGSYIERQTIQDEYAIGGPSWEAMIAPITGFALEEEEEELMREGQILLANDRKANRLISLFDEEERAMGQMLAVLGQPLLTMGTFPTSRSFLLNLPLLFLCKEKDTLCPICKSKCATKHRCARLPL
uniref:Uncharacterized protein n=1 Tax=Oryza punctata TaxID=4537 RepID=A0A0E0L9S3_ORYPU